MSATVDLGGYGIAFAQALVREVRFGRQGGCVDIENARLNLLGDGYIWHDMSYSGANRQAMSRDHRLCVSGAGIATCAPEDYCGPLWLNMARPRGNGTLASL